MTEGHTKVAVAGCRCTKGVLNKKKKFKVLRKGEIIYNGEKFFFCFFKAFNLQVYKEIIYDGNVE